MKWLLSIVAAAMAISGYTQHPRYAGTVELNGIQTYYEVYGSGGAPLFLLHGFTQSSKSWVPFVEAYSGAFEVYLVDLMGHGRSSPFTGDISIQEVAQNLRDLVAHLELDSIHAIGYSYGGEALFQLALIAPDLIKSMVIVGSCGTWNAEDFPGFVEYLSYENIDNLPWMRDHQLNTNRIKNILDQVPNYAVTVSEADLRRINTRTLLVIGDNDDATPLECAVKAKTYLPNAFLWIVPNTGHRVHLGENREFFVRMSRDFLMGAWTFENVKN